jgi:Putative rhamnosyl transferase
MENFNHLFLTKFNVRSFPEIRSGCDSAWLENRFGLFDRYCFPSVSQQSNQNFRWVVFFDIDTPNEFKLKIKQYSLQWSNFIPVYLNFPLPYGSFSDEARKIVQDLINKDCKYLITTWLDNDDAIHKDYVQMIQNEFAEQECETINFVFGYQLSSNKLYFDFEMANHFISLVEKYVPESFHTCLCKPHKEIYKICKSAKKIICKPVWIEVVHASNYMNVYRSGFRVYSGKILNDFYVKFNTPLSKEGLGSFLIEQFKISLFFPYYFLRKVFLRIKYKQLREFGISQFKFRVY